jgi:hypothetical protein
VERVSPCGASYCFGGTESFDGLNQPVAGDSCVTTAFRGDLNCDGLLNAFDIDPFVVALTDPAGYASLYPSCNWLCTRDINCDGSVNAFDIDPFVELLTGGQ